MPLRWFTPGGEVRLCGHATLATAHVLFTEIGLRTPRIAFSTLSGTLSVTRLEQPNTYQMNFPVDKPAATPVPDALPAAIGLPWQAVYKGSDDFLVILAHEEELRSLNPRMDLLQAVDARGVIVSAPGTKDDFVSRCFYPRYGIPEDPVTGSAHTLLTPYWAAQLGKDVLTARQLSAREGILQCTLAQDRVLLQGQAVTYLRGMIFL